MNFPIIIIIIIIIIIVWKIRISARYEFLLVLAVRLLAGRPENTSYIFTLLLPSQLCSGIRSMMQLGHLTPGMQRV